MKKSKQDDLHIKDCPKVMEIWLDGLDATTDGRGWNIKHQNAYEAIRRAINVHDELVEALKHAYARLNAIPHNYDKTNFKLIESAIAKAEGR